MANRVVDVLPGLLATNEAGQIGLYLVAGCCQSGSEPNREVIIFRIRVTYEDNTGHFIPSSPTQGILRNLKR
jgi:hypothetical protein